MKEPFTFLKTESKGLISSQSKIDLLITFIITAVYNVSFKYSCPK